MFPPLPAGFDKALANSLAVRKKRQVEKMEIFEQAHAKINLVLDVVGKRPDGFHELTTVFQSLTLHDTLKFTFPDSEGIELYCSDTTLPAGPENLAWQAALLLKEHYTVSDGVKITLDKLIPVAAGLGGGSSDAAAVLRGLIRFWQLPVEMDVLYKLAAMLGADVPFCLEGGTSFGMGKGEIIERLPPLPNFYVVLANPGFALPTAAVYGHYRLQGRHPDTSAMRRAIMCRDSDLICDCLGNSLESTAFGLRPEIAGLKDRMTAAGPSLMSGSGPTVFTLLPDGEQAIHLYKSLTGEGYAAWLTETSARRELGGNK